MNYKIIDENGEIQVEFAASEKWLPRLLERLMGMTTLEDVARYTPTQVTLLDQLQLLARQSESYPDLSAANAQAMCAIVSTLDM